MSKKVLSFKDVDSKKLITNSSGVESGDDIDKYLDCVCNQYQTDNKAKEEIDAGETVTIEIGVIAKDIPNDIFTAFLVVPFNKMYRKKFLLQNILQTRFEFFIEPFEKIVAGKRKYRT